MRFADRSLPLLAAGLWAACGSLIAVAGWAQPDPESAKIDTVAVADGLWMLVGPGGNIGVSAGEDGVFLIDDQYAPLTEKVVAAVRAISPRPIRFVLNTHWHDDHAGGNENFGKAGALIVAHDNVRLRMTQEHFLEAFGLHVPPSPAAALPVVTFSDAVTFHLNGGEIHAFHVPPAHTDGDSIVHFPHLDAVHLGDLYFNGMYPFIDVSTGGSIDGMIAAADRALEIVTERTKVLPGHGPLSNRAELIAFRDMLKTVRERVAALLAEGKSGEEIVAAKPLADLDERWGKGFLGADVFVGIVVKDLAE